MIASLSITNYALIDHIDLQFAPGFNIITGETGAGKSIMLGALSMLLGGRADTRVVRDGSRKSIVEAAIVCDDNDRVAKLCHEADVDYDESALILRREIAPSGRSRSFVNDTPVSLATMREIAMCLVDLHSQHQNLLLASPQYQLSILDTLLPDRSVIDLYVSAYNDYRVALKKYARARKEIENARQQEEYLRYQLEKLQDLNLESGEQDELERLREMLANATAIKLALRQIADLLQEDDTSAINRLISATSYADTIDALDAGAEITERLNTLLVEAKDVAATVESLYGSVEADPRRLELVEQRLSDIYELQRKHGVDTVEQLIAIRETIAAKVSAIDTADDKIRQFAAAARKAKAIAEQYAGQLSEARRQVAGEFSATLLESAKPLGMKNLRVEISFTDTELMPSGVDEVEFLFAFNKNQPMMPVKDTASGGEISRLMLSVKAILADKMNLPSIIFDEVDTGVSGDVALRMGHMMQTISKNIQVIAITHLPQVAARGVAHFKVYKQDSDEATHTLVERLSDSQRIDELALMLSGDSGNQGARDTARSLLAEASADLTRDNKTN